MPAGQAVPADQVELRLVAEEHAGRVVRHRRRTACSSRRADAHDEGGAGLAELVHDEAGEHLGVGHGHARRERRRPCAPAETDGASTSGTSSSAQASALVQQTSSSCSGGELMARQAKLPASPAAAAISCMVCSVSPPKGLETTIGLRVPRSMAPNWTTSTTSLATSSGSAMLIDEVDVGQRLDDARRGLDVGEQCAPPLARLRIGDVEAVGPAAEVAGAVAQLERRRLAAARRQRPGARRARDGVVDEPGGQPDPAPVDRGAGGGKELAGALVLHVDAGLLAAPPATPGARGCRRRRPRP